MAPSSTTLSPDTSLEPDDSPQAKMTTEPRPEYQHFVPQFLLRNFAHPYKPKGGKKRGKRKDENGIYNNELVVHNLDFTADPPVLCEKPVKRIFGQMNMYEDTSRSSPKRRHIEERLGKLESQASTIFRKITKGFDSASSLDGTSGVWLARDERNALRKFLFILKYRSSRFHLRFAHKTGEGYFSNDRELMRVYMEEKGYKRPIDVWFDGFNAIMDQDIDLEYNWGKEIAGNMFPPDAVWFFGHMQMYYMTICTPLDPNEEFLLTDSSYNVFEGPNCFGWDSESNEAQETAHCPLHYFAPISPKLMLVLRSNIFPNPLEDANEDVREERERFRKEAFDKHYGAPPGGKMGSLHDLPVRLAQNSYTRITADGRVVCDGLSKTDKFFFPFFAIGTKHVNTINACFLDNCSICTSIVFNSLANFARTIEWFLSTPSVGSIVFMAPRDGREEAIRKIEQISRSLGSKKTMVRNIVLPLPIRKGFMEHHTAKQLRIMKLFLNQGTNAGEALGGDGVFDSDSDSEPGEPDERFTANEHMALYGKLGGSLSTFEHDDDQACRMWTLRLKLDSWSRSVDEGIRQRNRDLLADAYNRLPPCRIWLYVRRRRFMLLHTGPEALPLPTQTGPIPANNPEDEIARGNHLVEPAKLSRLINNVSLVDTWMKKGTWQRIWGPLTPDGDGKKRFHFGMDSIHQHGFIRECGIPEIELLAQKAQLRIIRGGFSGERLNVAKGWSGVLDEGEMIELGTRSLVRTGFKAALAGKVGASLLDRLEEVFFEMAYPTPNWLDLD
ncbi:hypothetical protein B0T18DRAFT_416366 [Schizothecium vesticola]|uniref:Uncharacterized protein n=1 Tax=Schizothecium vesticola TaxID=314040 RepID=A0AA40ER62_9PEZI|nr:hypothetical protein B0T18DRAFT_416366 [Schizothecium vesticola]